jgi:peptidoglycan/LPS O-acetylase OafA/YrhL
LATRRVGTFDAVRGRTVTKRSNTRRITELDALRGIAALIVLSYHYSIRYAELFLGRTLPAATAVPFGVLGVHLFFVLSGFVIQMTLYRKQTIASFALARFFRLYPVFWCCVCVTFLLTVLYGPRPWGLTVLAYNLTMVPKVFHRPFIDGVYWSLAVELYFYFWIALVYLVRNRVNILASLSLWVGLSFLHALNRPRLPFVATYLILDFVPLFAMGIIFYILYDKKHEYRRLHLTALFNFSLLTYYLLYGFVPTLVVLAICAVFFSIIQGWLRFLSHPSLTFFGRISYPLYLLHQKIGMMVIHWLIAHNAGRMAATAGAVAVSVSLASLLTFAVERPVLRWSHSHFR